MDKKLNCWEVKRCGRDRGDRPCPATTEKVLNGINSGQAGGRACWAVAGTLCGGKVQGTFAAKMANCMDCNFYKTVKEEEGKNIMSTPKVLELLMKK